MIVLFHFIFYLAKYIVNGLSKSLTDETSASTDGSESECSNYEVVHKDSFTSVSRYLNGELKFFPPVYVQRYDAVSMILQESPWKSKIKKIVEFGCAEMGFFLYLKHIPGIEEILEIDINENILEQYGVKVTPLHSDYFLCDREKKLDVYVLCGNIADYDDHLLGTDVVIAIELIEHLKPDVLKKVPYNIFHEIKPKLAIFTTPNADFNVLFPNLKGFRHPEHEFEWSRKEFYKWTRGIIKNYPQYSVKFFGVGVGPEGTENLGCCTQVAVFERYEEFWDENDTTEPKGINNYKLIRKCEYPVYVDPRKTEDKILDEVSYRLKFSISNVNYYNCDNYTSEVPLKEFMAFVSQWCDSEENLKNILVEHGYDIVEKNGENILIYQYEEEPEDMYAVDHSSEENNSETYAHNETEAENWDWDCGVGVFNQVAGKKTSDEDFPCFMSVDSFREANDFSPRLCRDYRDSVGDQSEQGSLVNGSRRFNDVMSTPNMLAFGEPRNSLDVRTRTTSRIPVKKGIGKTSKSVKTLKSWIHSQIGF